MSKKILSDNDTPWKVIIEDLLEDFLAFFFQPVHEKIDFSKKYRFLSKELHKITRDDALGKRFADELAEVHLKAGGKSLLLIHIEVQGYEEKDFARRMFAYNHKIRARYDLPVISLAALTDDNPDFRPDCFEEELGGFKLVFSYPLAKILDYQGKEKDLQESNNPFAHVVLSQLAFWEFKNKETTQKFNLKWNLIKRLYEKGFSRKKVIDIFYFMDWILRLPEKEEELLEAKLMELEEVKKMPYISTIERKAEERGLEQGIEKMKNTARRLLALGVDIKVIQEATGLSEAQIKGME